MTQDILPKHAPDIGDAGLSIFSFLKHVHIEEPGSGVIHFQPWNHLLKFFKTLKSNRLIVVLKSKQIGVSWALAIWAVHHIYFTKSANVIVISKDQDAAIEFLRKCKAVYMNLPDWFKVRRVGPDNTESFGFLEYGSRIRAYPATKDAGVGQTGSIVIHDEADFHPYFKQNFDHSKATIDAGGQDIVVSTPNKEAPGSFFVDLYQNAVKGMNGFTPLFFGYDSRPYRTEEWYDRERQYAVNDGRLGEFEGNYPRTEDEALSPLSAFSAFNSDVVQKLWYNALEPVEVNKGYIHIFSTPKVGWDYAIGADVGEGVGGDYSACVVIGKYGGHKEVVALIYTNTLPTDSFAQEISFLGEEYFNCIVGVENNSIGNATLNKLDELNYKKIYYTQQTNTRKRGWTTGETNKRLAIAELIQEVNNGSLITSFKPMIQEIAECQVDKGKYIFSGKTHGDTVMALAIANQMIKDVRKVRKASFYVAGRKIFG